MFNIQHSRSSRHRNSPTTVGVLAAVCSKMWWKIFLLFTSVYGTILTKTSVQNPSATCVDGTSATYYQRILSTSTRWVIYVEDGLPSCLGYESTCLRDIQKFPYFTTSQDAYHPKTVNSTTFLSDDPNYASWTLSNLIYLNYCSMDGWLGSLLTPMYQDGYNFRGSINFRYSLMQILGTKTNPIAQRFKTSPSNAAEIILIGSGVGAMAVTYHLQWLINEMGFSSHQIQVIHDSFLIPTATIPVDKELFSILPTIAGSNQMIDTLWVNGYPCVWVYDCMLYYKFIPSELKILLLISSYDPVLLAYSSTLSTEIRVTRTFTSLTEFLSDYYSYGSATVQSSISIYSSSLSSISSTNTSIFIAGCLNHIYLMPISPSYRSSSQDLSYTHNISLGNDLITVLTTTSPSRYNSISFQGLNPSSSPASSRYTSPSSAPLTIAEMISIWYTSPATTTGELVGNICSTHLQCDQICFDEIITSPQREYSSESDLFNYLIMGIFFIFALVVFFTTLSVLLDFIYWTAYITTQIQPIDEGNHSDSLLQYSLTLSDLIKVEREKFLTSETQTHKSDEDYHGMTFKTHDDRYDIESVRDSLYEKYGKKTFIKHMAVSESNENNKLMSLIHSMDGQSAIFWLNLKCSMHLTLSSPPITDSWGQFRFGRVTAVLGPSGSGKSTLMRGLSGTLYSGTIQGSVEKHILLSCLEFTSERKRAISYISQPELSALSSLPSLSGILLTLSVERNLFYLTSLFATVPDQERTRAAVKSTLERCGLLTVKHKLLSELSLLEYRKFCLCVELVHNDPIMIIEEPFSGLDLPSSLELMGIIKNEALMMGKGMIVVAQEVGREMYSLIDDILLMKEGKTIYYGHLHHFQQYILPQIQSLSPLSSPILNPLTLHLSKYSDLYIPKSRNDLAGKTTLSISSSSFPSQSKKKAASAKYTQNQQYYASLFQQTEVDDPLPQINEPHELNHEGLGEGEGEEDGEDHSDLFTTNRVYNMFLEERKEQMREDRDRRVEREIEKDREKRGNEFKSLSPPSSPTKKPPPNSPIKGRGSARGEQLREGVFEYRKVEFDRVSDMMIQFCASLPESTETYSSLTSHLICPSLSTSLLLPSSLAYSSFNSQHTIFGIMEHMNSLLSIHHNTSLRPHYTLSSNYLLGTFNASSSYLTIFFSHLFFHIQKLLYSLSLTLYLHFLIYIFIFYGLLFLIYSLRSQYLSSSLYISLLYSIYIFFSTILLSLLWISPLSSTYNQHLINSSKSLPTFSSVLIYHLSTLSVCIFLSIILIIFLFSLMMYPLSLETEISLWVFYCGLMTSVLYGMVVITSIWLLIVLFQGNLNMVYRAISLFLLILPLSSGLLLNISFLPSLYSLFLLLNPIYIHFSVFTSLYLQDSCGLSIQNNSLFNDTNLCQNLIMFFFGFNRYGDQSGALILLFLWVLFLNGLSFLILFLSTIHGSVIFKSTQSIKELVHHPREIVVVEEKAVIGVPGIGTGAGSAAGAGVPGAGSLSPKKRHEIEMPRKESRRRRSSSNKNDNNGNGNGNGNGDGRDVDSSLSSRDTQEIKEIRTPNRNETPHTHHPHSHPHTPQQYDETPLPLHHDDLSLDISHLHSLSLSHPDQDSLFSPLGISLGEYQITAEFSYFKVFQHITTTVENELESVEILSILLLFEIQITKKNIIINFDEENPINDQLTIGVIPPASGREEEEEEEPDVFTLQLLHHIDTSTLKTKFNKHQLTLHLTGEIVTNEEEEGEEGVEEEEKEGRDDDLD